MLKNMKTNDKIKNELQIIVNLLFDFKNDHHLTDDEYNDLQVIINHVQNALNISKDYNK